MNKKKDNHISFCAVRIILTAIPTLITIKILVPAVAELRGYDAIGGEWFIVFAVYLISSAVARRLTAVPKLNRIDLGEKEIYHEYSCFDTADRK